MLDLALVIVFVMAFPLTVAGLRGRGCRSDRSDRIGVAAVEVSSTWCGWGRGFGFELELQLQLLVGLVTGPNVLKHLDGRRRGSHGLHTNCCSLSLCFSLFQNACPVSCYRQGPIGCSLARLPVYPGGGID